MDLFIHKRKKNMHNNEENKLYVMQDVSINYIMLVFTWICNLQDSLSRTSRNLAPLCFNLFFSFSSKSYNYVKIYVLSFSWSFKNGNNN